MTEKETILMKHISLRIRELRNTRKLSQRLMSYDTDLNIGRIEACQHMVSIATIARICQYFDISLSEFFQDFTEKIDI